MARTHTSRAAAVAQESYQTSGIKRYRTVFWYSTKPGRFAWSHMPPYVAPAGDALVMLGWLAIFFVFKENFYVCYGQKVISTGPYACSYNPM
jgi:protein-S-isoprenylcysteine O-methyltransferase Ste14